MLLGMYQISGSGFSWADTWLFLTSGSGRKAICHQICWVSQPDIIIIY